MASNYRLKLRITKTSGRILIVSLDTNSFQEACRLKRLQQIRKSVKSVEVTRELIVRYQQQQSPVYSQTISSGTTNIYY